MLETARKVCGEMSIDQKVDMVLGHLIEVRDQIGRKVLLSSVEVWELINEGLVMLVRVVVLVDEVCDKSFHVNVKLSKF